MPSVESTVAADAPGPEPRPRGTHWWAVSPAGLPLVGLACALFLILNYLPVRGFGLWGHVIHGNWILDHGALPREDPMLAFGEGMRVIDDAWLSQVVLAATERAQGAEGLSTAAAVALLLAFLLLGRALYLRSRSRLASLAGLAAALALGWGWLTSLGPQSFGYFCFALLLWSTAGAETGERRHPGPPWRLWLGLPLLFALWANLHGSFVFGLLLLSCLALGRAIDVAWHQRSWRAMLADGNARRRIWLLELAILASLANPYGFGLLDHTVAALLGNGGPPSSPPIVLTEPGGAAFALSWLVVLVVLRHSRRRVPASDVLMLVAFSAAAAPMVSRLLWFGPVLAMALAPHLGTLRARWQGKRVTGRLRALGEAARRAQIPTGASWHYTLLALLMAWVAFALSPTGGLVLGGTKRKPLQVYGQGTPQLLTAHLAANPPPTPVFNPAEWGDWIAWDGPAGLRPFATANVEALPRRVWLDYQSVARGEAGWERTLRRYGIRSIILDRQLHRGQTQTLRYSKDWALLHEDAESMVFHHASTLPALEPGNATAAEPAGETTVEQERP